MPPRYVRRRGTRPLVARRARLAVVEDDQRARAASARARTRCSSACAGRDVVLGAVDAARRRRRAAASPRRAGRRAGDEARSGRPRRRRRAARSGQRRRWAGQASCTSLATIAPRMPASCASASDARARHARPRLGEHARRALAEHELERQVRQLGGEAAPPASRHPGPISASVNGSGRPSRSQTRAQIGGQRAREERRGDGRRRERAARPEPRAARVEAVLRRRRARSP